MSMNARKFTCKVTAKEWVTPSVIRLAFEPNRSLHFEPGQFLSLNIPVAGSNEVLKRAYSFTSSYERTLKDGYEICMKYNPGGAGSEYIKSLNPGDSFECSAPYGDFVYHPPKEGRGVAFICTGTGISPLRAMALSKEFQESPPAFSSCFFGARHEDEILYAGSFESVGIKTIYCVSQAKKEFTGFSGRITDYIKSLPLDWDWHTTDFYICGNAGMIQEVTRILMGGHGVSQSAIHQEVFFFDRRISLRVPPKKAA